MDRVISGIVDWTVVPLGNAIGWMADHGVLAILFIGLWVVFGVALVWSQGSLDATWSAIQSLPLILQAVVWLLFLPVVAGLWIWETSLPLLARLLVVGGLAGSTILMFLPRAAGPAQP